MNLTRTEAYLSTFHDANPGVTSRAFETPPVSCGELAFGSALDLACGDGHMLALLRDSRPDSRLALIGVGRPQL